MKSVILHLFLFSIFSLHLDVYTFTLNQGVTSEETRKKGQGVVDTSFTIETPKSLRTDWKFKAPFGIPSSPVIWEDYVYMAVGFYSSKNKYLLCIQKDTGKLNWTSETKYMIGSSPVISGDYILVKAGEPRSNQIVYCVDRLTGALQWKHTITGEKLTISSPVVSGEHVYIGVENQKESDFVLCLDKNSAEVIWKLDTEGLDMQNSRPFIQENHVYIGTGIGDGLRVKGQLICVDKHTGTLLWASETVNKNFSSTCPVIMDDYVYYENLCLNRNTGKINWQLETEGKELSSRYPFVVDGNHQYVLSSMWGEDIGSWGKGVFYCLDRMTGALKWKYETEGSEVPIEPPVPPVVDGNHLYILLTTRDLEMEWSKGIIYCLDRITGALNWKHEIKGYFGEQSSLVISEKRLYSNGVTDEKKGAVFCLDRNTGKLKWQFENIVSEYMRMEYSGWTSTKSVISGNYTYCSGILGKQGYVFCLDRFTGELKRKLRTDGQIPFDPVITNGKVYVATRAGTLFAYRQGNLIILYILDISLGIFLFIPIILLIPFGFFSDQMHRWIERRSGRPDFHEEQRYQNRYRKLEQILQIANGLARALSGGSNLIIINIYWGWLLLFYIILTPIFIPYLLIIIIPLDPWFPKWWPYAVYCLYIFCLSMVLFLSGLI